MGPDGSVRSVGSSALGCRGVRLRGRLRGGRAHDRRRRPPAPVPGGIGERRRGRPLFGWSRLLFGRGDRLLLLRRRADGRKALSVPPKRTARKRTAVAMTAGAT